MTTAERIAARLAELRAQGCGTHPEARPNLALWRDGTEVALAALAADAADVLEVAGFIREQPLLEPFDSGESWCVQDARRALELILDGEGRESEGLAARVCWHVREAIRARSAVDVDAAMRETALAVECSRALWFRLLTEPDAIAYLRICADGRLAKKTAESRGKRVGRPPAQRPGVEAYLTWREKDGAPREIAARALADALNKAPQLGEPDLLARARAEIEAAVAAGRMKRPISARTLSRRSIGAR